MKKKELTLTASDFHFLKTLWKWKLLTTKAIHTTCYRSLSLSYIYQRLLHFEKTRLIESISSWDQKVVVWQLADKGFQIILSELGQLYENGFKSENKEHDFWVTAIHLGDWLNGVPNNCDLFTEQELRRYSTTEYKPWVPQSKIHRPDGWWHKLTDQSNDLGLISLEVELSKKSPVAYNDVGSFYSKEISVHQVIWFVKSASDANYIHRHIIRGCLQHGENHSFILLDQFIQLQWQSKIFLGKNINTTLASVLNTTSIQGVDLGNALELLDVRKKPIISIAQPKLQNTDLRLRR
jgi:hypothetical protein